MRAGVCDDSMELSRKIAEIVKNSFENIGVSCEVEAFSDGSELLNDQAIKPFDVLFLDIDMPGLSGFDIARRLRFEGSDCIIVFVTSHAELVYDSFDFQPFNFIRKSSGLPLEKSIPKIADKLSARLMQSKTVTVVDRDSGKVTLRVGDIIYIESSGHYLIYNAAGREKIISRGIISEREEFFGEYGFARVHKGFLVNLSHVVRMNIQKREVELTGGVRVPIGKSLKNRAEEKYTLYLRRKS